MNYVGNGELMPSERANSIAEQLQKDERDGWSYVVEHVANGMARIQVRDNDGFTVGAL